jgi:hypothetical protein
MIEECNSGLQEKNQLVFEGTVGRDAEALGKLSVDDPSLPLRLTAVACTSVLRVLWPRAPDDEALGCIPAGSFRFLFGWLHRDGYAAYAVAGAYIESRSMASAFPLS